MSGCKLFACGECGTVKGDLPSSWSHGLHGHPDDGSARVPVDEGREGRH